MEPKRILFIVESLAMGGLSRVIVTLAEALHARGHCIGVAVLSPFVEEHLDGSIWLKIHKRQPPTKHHGAFRRRAGKFGAASIKEFEQCHGPADLVIAAGELGLRCANQFRHPRLVFSLHISQLGVPKHPGLRGYCRHAFKRWRRGMRLRHLLNGKAIHVVSDGLAFELRNIFAVKPGQLTVIGNPFDIESIRAEASRGSPESAAQTRPFVVGVGALVYRKRFDRLIRAFAQSGLDGDLILIGQGDQETALRELALELGLNDRVRILPFHPNHYALVARARALVLTSDSEGLGNVLIEGLILGVPVISTDCPHGPRDILQELDSRALIPLDRVDLLAQRLHDIAREPYTIPEAAVQRYELDRIVDQYLVLADQKALPAG